MKRHSAGEAAMTLIEVLVVIAVFGIVIAMYLQMRSPPPDRTTVTACLFDLKQIDIGFLMYTADNGGKFPMQSSITNGGTMEFLQRNQTFPHYQKLSQYFSSPTILVCPVDKNRHATTNFQTMGRISVISSTRMSPPTTRLFQFSPGSEIFRRMAGLFRAGCFLLPRMWTSVSPVSFIRRLARWHLPTDTPKLAERQI